MAISLEFDDEKKIPAKVKRLSDGEVLSAYELATGHGRVETMEDLVNVAELMELILNNIYSGIICCDRECTIVFMNKVFGEILRVDPAGAIGTKITEYFPDSRLPQVMELGQPEFGHMCKFKSHQDFVVNRIPIKIRGTVVGAILQSVYRNYQEIKDLMHKLEYLEKKVDFYQKGFTPRFSFNDIIGESEAMVATRKTAMRYASIDAPVLVLGATGTGKELFAHAIHSASFRRRGSFIWVNCAGIPKDLIESELFGYTPGAFTGASTKGKVGKIGLADKGTLFLDEIGDLPLSAQAKILRVIETRTLEKLGSVHPTEVDFRLVAATNKDLKAMIRRNEFREDLFYRINGLTLELPTLAERMDDLPILINHFLRRMCRPNATVSDEAMRALKGYFWPGNIRELKNVIERAVSLSESNTVEVEHLPWEISRARPVEVRAGKSVHGPLAEELSSFEEKILRDVLASAKGNMAKAARLLNISRSTLYEKCHQYKVGRVEEAKDMSG